MARSYANSEGIDLSDYTGETIFIGFCYLGADFIKATIYQLDNIEIKFAQ